MRARHRKLLLALLALAFAAQSLLVYTDSTARVSGQLSEQALRGRSHWQKNNCQTCHQLYGMGGHLGPDLTNVASALNEAALGAFLAVGPKQMPRFRLSGAEIHELHRFLTEMAATGVSPARAGRFRLREVPWFVFGATSQ